MAHHRNADLWASPLSVSVPANWREIKARMSLWISRRQKATLKRNPENDWSVFIQAARKRKIWVTAARNFCTEEGGDWGVFHVNKKDWTLSSLFTKPLSLERSKMWLLILGISNSLRTKWCLNQTQQQGRVEASLTSFIILVFFWLVIVDRKQGKRRGMAQQQVRSRFEPWWLAVFRTHSGLDALCVSHWPH